MIVTCQACGAENDDEARYCDQCAAPLAGALLENSAGSVAAPACPACGASTTPDARFCAQCGTPLAPGAARPAAAPAPAAAALPPATPIVRRPGGAVNWLGLGIVGVVVLGIVWLSTGGGKSGAGPMAGGGGAGGGDQGTAVFQQVQQQLKQDKDALAKDPLDEDAVKDLYTLYSQIGQPDKVRPFLETALAEAQKRVGAGGMTAGDATKLALDLGTAAMNGNDPLGAIDALKFYYQLNPQRVDTAKMVGDIYYDMRMADESVEWYQKYLKAADPAKDSAAYVNAQVDMATMQMQIADKENQPDQLKAAVSGLQAVVQAHPEHWAARFNLGQALLQGGDKAGAEEAWKACQKLAGNATEKWRTAAALAELHGQPAPPKPAGVDDSGSGSASEAQPMTTPADGSDPHAGMLEPPAGTPNPHESPTFGQGVPGETGTPGS
jgi:tetratricopeptide (TPR) repeat protein